jgi:hypothetical protein
MVLAQSPEGRSPQKDVTLASSLGCFQDLQIPQATTLPSPRLSVRIAHFDQAHSWWEG